MSDTNGRSRPDCGGCRERQLEALADRLDEALRLQGVPGPGWSDLESHMLTAAARVHAATDAVDQCEEVESRQHLLAAAGALLAIADAVEEMGRASL